MQNKVEQKINPQQFLVDKFLQSLDRQVAGGDENAGDSIWEEKPVSIKEFIESPQFCGEKYNYETHGGCRPAILEEMEHIANPSVREAILILGSGAGKGYSCSRLACYMAYCTLCLKNPQKYYGLAEGDPIYIVNLAINEDQARDVIFAYIKAVLTNCQWFQGKYEEQEQKIKFAKNLTLISGDSAAQGWFGYNVLFGIFDELAFWTKTKRKDWAKEAWEALTASKTHGFLKKYYKAIAITTAGIDDCFIEKEFDRVEKMQANGDGQDKYISRRAVWDVRLDQTIEDYADDLARDYNWAMAKFGARKMHVSDPYFTDSERERFENNMGHTIPLGNTPSQLIYSPYLGDGQLAPEFKAQNCPYKLHIDLSSVSDRTVLTLGHIKGYVTRDDEELPVIKIDLMITVDPTLKVSKDQYFITNINGTNRVDYAKLRHFIYRLRGGGFEIDLVSFDTFKDEEMKNKLVSNGFIVENVSADKNKLISQTGKMLCLDGRVEMPYNELLAEELKGLYDDGKKIEHIKEGYKDHYDSYCCCVFNLVQSADNGGILMTPYDDPEDEADMLGVKLQKTEKGTPLFTKDDETAETFFSTNVWSENGPEDDDEDN